MGKEKLYNVKTWGTFMQEIMHIIYEHAEYLENETTGLNVRERYAIEVLDKIKSYREKVPEKVRGVLSDTPLLQSDDYWISGKVKDFITINNLERSLLEFLNEQDSDYVEDYQN